MNLTTTMNKVYKSQIQSKPQINSQNPTVEGRTKLLKSAPKKEIDAIQY